MLLYHLVGNFPSGNNREGKLQVKKGTCVEYLRQTDHDRPHNVNLHRHFHLAGPPVGTTTLISFTIDHSFTTATMAPNGTSAASFYAEDKNLIKLCDFLRSGDGPAVREAIEMDKRVYYIKGPFSILDFHKQTLFYLLCINH